ncbi:hypothetical protein WJ13_11675 [Burkholderia seminalis]|nr:hypothetical protein WJ13_11675 [Burkholderia seminalis]
MDIDVRLRIINLLQQLPYPLGRKFCLHRMEGNLPHVDEWPQRPSTQSREQLLYSLFILSSPGIGMPIEEFDLESNWLLRI